MLKNFILKVFTLVVLLVFFMQNIGIYAQENNDKEVSSEMLINNGIEALEEGDHIKAEKFFNEAWNVYNDKTAKVYLDRIKSKNSSHYEKLNTTTIYDDKTQEAIDAYNNGNYELARSLFEKILLNDRQNNDAIEYLVKISRQNKEKQAAENEKRKKAEEQFYKGVIAFNDGEYDTAKELFQKALSVYPEDTQFKKYLTKTEEKILEKQIQEKNRALSGAITDEAECFFAIEDYKYAREKVDDALQLYPDNTRAQDLLSKILEKEAQIKKEKEKKEKANEILEEVKKLFNQGDFQGSLEKTDQILLFYPDNERALYWKETNSQKIQHQKEQLQKKTQSDIFLMQGVDFYDIGDFQQAKKLFEKALDIYPKNKEAAGFIVKADEAIFAQEKIKATRLVAKDMYSEAKTFYEKGDLPQAKEKLQAAMELLPGDELVQGLFSKVETLINEKVQIT
ncbi:MAG: tetratricopeptide repeat protein, partial [Candidatus Omnitrophica bacterium]|nr:tetratricopeptide repeat protein [Candidatus Omnitrophota bacterium]